MHRLSIILLLITTVPVFAQTEVSWLTLSDVHFSDKYDEEEEAYYYFPNFGPSVLALEGKDVVMKGYILVLGAEQDSYILSSNPYASCFFCGAGGPDSIVQLKFKPGHPNFVMDEYVTIRGTLILNDSDIYQCNYILEEAESVN